MHTYKHNFTHIFVNSYALDCAFIIISVIKTYIYRVLQILK